MSPFSLPVEFARPLSPRELLAKSLAKKAAEGSISATEEPYYTPIIESETNRERGAWAVRRRPSTIAGQVTSESQPPITTLKSP